MHALREEGKRVLAMKPVASGCDATAEGLRSQDALLLQAAASDPMPYEEINPYAFAPAIAPHLAAQSAGTEIDFERIAAQAEALGGKCDHLLVEGVGGWRVPLGAHQTVAELAARLGLPVILVVGLRLGCINHALLTAEGIERAGLPLAGWVANLVDPQMEAVIENVRELALRLPAPLLGIIPHLKGRHPRIATHVLDLSPLLR